MTALGYQNVGQNAILNTLSAKKCNHLYFFLNKRKCYSSLKADEIEMKKSTECSYLGDILCTNGSIDATIEGNHAVKCVPN